MIYFINLFLLVGFLIFNFSCSFDHSKNAKPALSQPFRSVFIAGPSRGPSLQRGDQDGQVRRHRPPVDR